MKLIKFEWWTVLPFKENIKIRNWIEIKRITKEERKEIKNLTIKELEERLSIKNIK